jgi:glycosyltransferase involved in cell wall biosynthesis
VSTHRHGIRLAYLTLEAPRQGQASFAHVFEIVEGLRRLGFPVDLYLPRYTEAQTRPSLLRRFWEHLWLQGRLIAGWRRYHLIYVRGHNMAFPAALVAWVTGKPIIHEVNGPHLDITVTYPWTRYFNGLLAWLQRTQYRWAGALVPVTPQLQQWLRTEGCANTIEVIPNGANLGLFNPNREDDSDRTGLFPIKLFEILACGTPAIVSDYPGQADLVRSAQCGLVIAPGDPKALAGAVATVARDAEERKAMGVRGHALIVAEHSWERRAAQTADLVERIVRMRSPA